MASIALESGQVAHGNPPGGSHGRSVLIGVVFAVATHFKRSDVGLVNYGNILIW